MGVVILANKSYPIDARVTAANEILTRLDDGSSRLIAITDTRFSRRRPDVGLWPLRVVMRLWMAAATAAA